MAGWHPDESQNLAAVSVINVLDAEGELLWSPSTESQPVLSSQLAFLVHDVLSDSQGWQSDSWQQISPSINRPAGVKLGKIRWAKCLGCRLHSPTAHCCLAGSA